MNQALHMQFRGPWERRDYSPPPGGVAADQESYVVEVVLGRRKNHIVHAAVSPDEGDEMVRAHNGRKWN